ncbi:hypothetical protein KHA80_04105 [Anaerobacillus sp. HL2]|nr:hypothetical protein KHA80_04105 [Anaerobacillus sp. HL2]
MMNFANVTEMELVNTTILLTGSKVIVLLCSSYHLLSMVKLAYKTLIGER